MKTLKTLREQHGFLQKELASKFHVHPTLLGKLERIEINLSPKIRRKYMRQFKLSPQELEEIWQETLAQAKQNSQAKLEEKSNRELITTKN